MGRRAQLRPRQGDDGRGARSRQGLRPLPRRRRRRHPVPHLARHARERGAYFTRGTTRDAYARYSEAGPDYVYNVERLLKKFETAKALVPQPVVRAAAQARRASAPSTTARPARRWPRRSTLLQRAGHPCGRAARARVPVQRGGRPFHRRTRDGVRRRAEPRRAVAHLARHRAGAEPGAARAGAALRRHADHRALHRRGDREPRAAQQRAADQQRKGRHDLSRQADSAPPDAAEERARLHAARLRRQDQHAVRRLRARLDLRRAGAGLLGARHRAAPRGQAVGHRLLVEDARLLPRQLARLQHRARPHAVRC